MADIITPYYEADICGAYFNMVDVLAGDWTMTATVIEGDKRVETSKNVQILDEYTDFPSEVTDEIYKVYRENTKWTDDEIVSYYNNEFLQPAKTFNTKRLANQNKLMLMGWLDGGIAIDNEGKESAYQTMTPYDLFVHKTINTVDVPSIFSDFGPKSFIEVSEVNGKAKLTITADMYFGSPVMNWIDPFYLAGFADQESNNTLFYYSDPVTGYYVKPLVFDLELSDDKNTLTIKAIERDGIKYYPNVIGQDSMTGRYLLNKPIVSEVVLTRGHSAAAQASARKSAARSYVAPESEALKISRKKMTRFEQPETYKKIEMEVMTLDKARANMAEYLREMHNNTK